MGLEFIYEDTTYKYDGSRLYYKDCYGIWWPFCSVLNELNTIIETLDANQRITVLEVIVYSYLSGYSDGKKAKVKEIKKVLNID